MSISDRKQAEIAHLLADTAAELVAAAVVLGEYRQSRNYPGVVVDPYVSMMENMGRELSRAACELADSGKE